LFHTRISEIASIADKNPYSNSLLLKKGTLAFYTYIVCGFDYFKSYITIYYGSEKKLYANWFINYPN
jgi:hypothetical protein